MLLIDPGGLSIGYEYSVQYVAQEILLLLLIPGNPVIIYDLINPSIDCDDCSICPRNNHQLGTGPPYSGPVENRNRSLSLFWYHHLRVGRSHKTSAPTVDLETIMDGSSKRTSVVVLIQSCFQSVSISNSNFGGLMPKAGPWLAALQSTKDKRTKQNGCSK